MRVTIGLDVDSIVDGLTEGKDGMDEIEGKAS